MPVLRHLKALMWKNALLMRRNWRGSLLELLLPVALVSAMIGVFTQFPLETTPTSNFVGEKLTIPPLGVLAARLQLSEQNLCVLPSDTTLAQHANTFLEWLATTYPGFDGSAVTWTSPRLRRLRVPALASVIRRFQSSDDLDDHIKSDAYGDAGTKIWACIVLNSGPPTWDYSLRFNSSEVPGTAPPFYDRLQRGVDLDTVGQYVMSQPSFGDNLAEQTPDDPVLAYKLPGFTSLQVAVDRFIINRTTAMDGMEPYALMATFASSLALLDPVAVAELELELATLAAANTTASRAALANITASVSAFLSGERYLPQQVQLVPFPVSSFTYSWFYKLASTVFAIYLVLSYLYPVSRLIRGIVHEKEARLREGMRMMGLADSALTGSWLLTYGCVFTILAVVIAIMLSATFYSNSNGFLIFLLFLFFGWSATTWCFLVSVFFSRAKTAASVGVVSFLALAFPYYGVAGATVGAVAKHGSSICAPTAFALTIDILSKVESNGQGVTLSSAPMNVYGYSASWGIGWLVIDTILYAIIGAYLDAVLPYPIREHGIPQRWNFICTRRFWRQAVGSLPSDDGSNRPRKEGAAKPAVVDAAAIEMPAAPSAPAEGTRNDLIEPLDSGLQSKLTDGRCVSVRGLHKEFAMRDGVKVAVDGVDLDLFEGQIFVLLGHNGAGKTTTISMLTGLIPPTSGRVSVFGNDIKQNIGPLRNMLGVCPQNDVLWPELTVKEHLELFAAIKGVPLADVPSSIADVISQVGLAEKMHARAGTLSGGMKRKLCVAISFLGDSKVVFLDEPTSGMDPYSRRSTWQILQNARQGRVIVLTTHFMDEADILGDRIAIMSRGQVRCCGTPMFLKQKYHIGYCLTCAKTTVCDPSEVLSLVRQHAPSAAIESNVGAELSISLPLDGSLAHLFTDLESRQSALGLGSVALSVTTLEQVFMRVAKDEKDDADDGKHDVVKPGVQAAEVLPREAGDVLEAPVVAAAVEPAECTLVDHDGAPHTCDNGMDDDSTPAAKPHEGEPRVAVVMMPPTPSSDDHQSDSMVERETTSKPPAAAPTDIAQPALIEHSWLSTFLVHFRALLIKRVQVASRDKRTLFYSLLIPVCVIIGGVGLIQLAIPSELPSFPLTTAAYNTDPNGDAYSPMYPFAVPALDFKTGAPWSTRSGSSTSAPVTSRDIRSVISCQPSPNVSSASPRLSSSELRSSGDPYQFVNTSSVDADLQAVSSWLLSTRGGSAASTFVAIAFDGPDSAFPLQNDSTIWAADGGNIATYAVLHNTTGPHTGPTGINLLNSALLAASQGDPCAAPLASSSSSPSSSSPSWSITTRNHPLPYSKREAVLLASYLSGSAAVIIMIALAFVPASFAAYVVKEREVSAKHQQLISGVSIPAYWASMWTFDTISALVPCLLTIAVLTGFGVRDFTSPTGHRLNALITLFVLYAGSIPGFTYILSYLFKSHSSAQNAVLMINLLSVLMMIASMIMGQALGLAETCKADAGLRYVYRFFPGFSLGNGMLTLAFLDLQPSLNAKCREAQGERVDWNSLGSIDAFDWKGCGTNIAFLAVEAVLYTLLAIAVDVGLSVPAVRLWVGRDLSLSLWCRRAGDRGEVTDWAAPPGDAVPSAYTSPDVTPDDPDVAAEAARLAASASIPATDIIQLHNLRKAYAPTAAHAQGTVAVHGLSFGVTRGEVFGFLGINGAGKTTTLQIITGDLLPTSGTAKLGGLDIITQQPQVRRLLGYCPQFDALLELLTVKEHLELYARIKGVPEKEVHVAASGAMAQLGITEFANKPAGTLSGGTKRKLSVAIALIGSPPIVFLDEPSTGMDPVSRRFMWAVLSRLASQDKACSIILTTHSMEEVEALCTRIGIMVGGRLRCLGSSTHLRSRFGQGFEVEVKLHAPTRDAIERLEARMVDALKAKTAVNSSAVAVEADTSIASGSVTELCSRLGSPHRSLELNGDGDASSIVFASALLSAFRRSTVPSVESPLEAKRIPIATVAQHWAEEDQVDAMTAWVTQSAFPSSAQALDGGSSGNTATTCKLIERQGSVLRYRVVVHQPPGHDRLADDGVKQQSQDQDDDLQRAPGCPFSLSRLFTQFESAMSALNIASFAVSHSSLETVFNHFASQQRS